MLDRILALYKDVCLAPYDKSYRGEKGCGYYLVKDGKRVGGVSIGSQEAEILYRIVQLSDAKFTFVVGVAFGFSTACIALASPRNMIFALDNYSENNGDYPYYYVESVARKVLGNFPNVYLHVGTSPQDTPKCLEELPRGARLTLAFIDGEHTDKAAEDDFIGLRPYIYNQSIIIWHDIDKTSHAYAKMFDPSMFDRSFQLPTWGHMGVYLNSLVYPSVNEYLSFVERSCNEA